MHTRTDLLAAFLVGYHFFKAVSDAKAARSKVDHIYLVCDSGSLVLEIRYTKNIPCILKLIRGVLIYDSDVDTCGVADIF